MAMTRFLAAAALTVGLITGAAADDPFPPEVQGLYGKNGDCSGFWKVQVFKDMVEFNDDMGDSLRLTLWDVCLACAGGAGYDGIQVYAFPEQLGTDRAPVFKFNEAEKPGRLVIEYHGKDPIPYPRLADAIAASPLQKCR